MKKPVVGVVFGSRSSGHDVSIITAIESIIKPLNLSDAYDVLPMYIAKDGNWYADKTLGDMTLFNNGTIDSWLKKHDPITLALGDGLRLVRKGWRSRDTVIDVVFPALHGTHGEDGDAMGLFEIAGVPYVGCSLASSVVAMDRVLTKLVVQASGIPVVAFEYFKKHAFETDPDEWVTRINRHLHYPLFVKTTQIGPGIGITRVADPSDLCNAINVALRHDDQVVVEEAVQNLLQVSLPVIGNDSPRPGLLDQSVIGDEVLPKDLYATAEATGLSVYRALGCSGIALIDMLIDTKTKTVYCDEVHPMPANLCQPNWNLAGISNIALVSELVSLAMERHAKK